MKAARVLLNSSLLALTAIAPYSAHAGSKPFKNGPTTIVLDSPISTTLNKPGDSFVARVTQPTEIEGAIIEGHITKIEPAKDGNAPKSHIVFGFETITIGDSTYKIQATLKEVTNAKGVQKVDEEGDVLGQGNGLKRAMFAGGGSGLGALAGGMLGGGVGALAGGLAGGALGYVVSLDFTTSGKNIDFFPGSTFVLDVTDKGINKDVKAADVRILDANALAAQQKPAAPSSPVAESSPATAAPRVATTSAVPSDPPTAPQH